MAGGWKCYFSLCTLLALSSYFTAAAADRLKSATFLSPNIHITLGLVANKIFPDMEFPKGHIGIKSFHGEIVDENMNSVPLYEAYLHHWVVKKYFQRKGTTVSSANLLTTINQDIIFPGGAEARKTATVIPDPYAIEAGNTSSIPVGFEEKWMLNVHTIDTRGAADKFGCVECRCDVYNVTAQPGEQPLPNGYVGGLKCCPDKYRCPLRKGFQGLERKLYMRYTVKWVEWDASVFPVRILALDVTDVRRSSGKMAGGQTEYSISACSQRVGRRGDECIMNNRTSIVVPKGGYLVFAVGHQHVAGRGITLYGEDGRVLCVSMPIYGRGREAGNENGYVVGMRRCYPEIGAVKMMDKEAVILESKYNNEKSHSGVMGIFYILLADQLPNVKKETNV